LTGNPFDRWPKARAYIIAHLPGLQRLDGQEITKSERLKALAVIKELDEVSTFCSPSSVHFFIHH
jgi:hypothetical protein